MPETKRNREAFEYWFGLLEKGYGKTDAIIATAKQYNVIKRTVWSWWKKFNWDERKENRENEIIAQMEKNLIKNYAKNREKYLSIAHKLLDDFIKKGCPVDIESTKDLETVVKLCQVLQDKPSSYAKTENTNHNHEYEELFDTDAMEEIVNEETPTDDSE